MPRAESTREVVIALLRPHVAPERAVEDTSDLVADLGLDSVTIVELTGEIEDRFEIRITDEALVQVTSVQDLVRVVETVRADAAGRDEEP